MKKKYNLEHLDDLWPFDNNITTDTLPIPVQPHSDEKNVESMRKNPGHGVALEGACWINQEGKTCAKLVELTGKVFYITRNVFQVMLINLVIHQLELPLQANK